MEYLFDLLSQKGLKDDNQIERLIMHDLSIMEIVDLREQFYEIIKKSNPSVDLEDISNFSFHSDSNMSAQHNYCPEWTCRLSRIDELARFAGFYTDSVYIQNYFSDFEHRPSNEYEDFWCRYELVGDIKILYLLKNLILNGIVRFVPPLDPETGHICPECFKQFVPEYNKIDKYLKMSSTKVTGEYLHNTDITVSLDPHFSDSIVYDFHISGSEDLFPHGRIVRTVQEKSLPKSMRTMLKSIPDSELKKGYHLSKDEIKKSLIIKRTLLSIFRDIWSQRCLLGISNSHLKYLTQSDIEIRFLNDITKNSRLNSNNETIRNNLVYELPIILDIPLDTIVDIRNSYYDSFICFRDSIDHLIIEYLSKKELLSPSIAVEFYDDVVKPKLSKINVKVKSIQDSHLKKAKSDIIISAASLTFGAFSTFFIPPIASYTLALSAVESSRAIKSIYDAFQVPDEIQNDNLYFLWKLQPKTTN